MAEASENPARTQEYVERDRACMGPTARIPYYDLVVDHARGALLYDVEGNEYIDLLAAATSANVGHSHPAVVEAICGQAQKVIQCSPAYFYHAPEVELVEKLAAIAPGDTPKKVVFGTSGSDANDAIIKFARAYTGRPYVVSFLGAYHGSTYGSMTLSALSLGMRRKMGPMLPGIYHIPYPDVQSAGVGHLSEPEQAEHFMRPLREMCGTYLPADEIACVVMEPIAGDAGIIVPPQAYVDALTAFCRENGILFAVDEINQGMGRTGKWWGIEQFGVEPDLMSVGKSLASGLPLSAIVGKADIMDSLSFPAHIFTTSGNPVCCAAALATIDVIEREGLLRAGRLRKGALRGHGRPPRYRGRRARHRAQSGHRHRAPGDGREVRARRAQGGVPRVRGGRGHHLHGGIGAALPAAARHRARAAGPRARRARPRDRRGGGRARARQHRARGQGLVEREPATPLLLRTPGCLT